MGSFDREHFEQLLSDPEARARMAELLEELSQGERPRRFWRRAMPALASLGAASVTALAFLIPSIEDQWDRWRARGVVEAYADVGHRLMDEQRYAEAAGAFEKAQELADNPRIELELARLRAQTSEVLEDTRWHGANPKGLEEQSFLMLEQLERDHADRKARAETITHHGLFLVSNGHAVRAEKLFRSAIALDPSAVDARVNLANLLSDGARAREAETEYRRALHIDPGDIDARYNLALLLEQERRLPEAETELRRTLELARDDEDALEALARVLDSTGQADEASALRGRAAHLESGAADSPGNNDEG